jgi:hypothetical protein
MRRESKNWLRWMSLRISRNHLHRHSDELVFRFDRPGAGPHSSSMFCIARSTSFRVDTNHSRPSEFDGQTNTVAFPRIDQKVDGGGAGHRTRVQCLILKGCLGVFGRLQQRSGPPVVQLGAMTDSTENPSRSKVRRIKITSMGTNGRAREVSLTRNT